MSIIAVKITKNDHNKPMRTLVPVQGLWREYASWLNRFCYVYFNVTIHPFEDGNGRIARAIADMALARADGTSSRFYSMSRQIEQERKAYYTQLERQQKGSFDITPWLSWFLNCFSRAVVNAEDTLSSVFFKAELWNRINPDPVNERQRLIINRMLDNFKGHVTTSKYAKLAKCSSDTALRDMRGLVARHILIQNPGGGRSTSCRLITAEELEQSSNGG